MGKLRYFNNIREWENKDMIDKTFSLTWTWTHLNNSILFVFNSLNHTRRAAHRQEILKEMETKYNFLSVYYLFPHKKMQNK